MYCLSKLSCKTEKRVEKIAAGNQLVALLQEGLIGVKTSFQKKLGQNTAKYQNIRHVTVGFIIN